MKKKPVNVNELIYEVNKWDKQFGIKIKSPELWRDPENYFKILAAKADMNLAALLCCVNGINPDSYFNEELEVPKFAISTDDINFLEDSIIDWENKDFRDMNSYEFRIKFVSLTLSQLIGSMGRVALNYTMCREKVTNSIYEHATINLVKISKMCSKFIRIMLNGGKYENIILMMNELITYANMEKQNTKLQSCLNGHVLQLRRAVVKDPLTKKRFFADDITIYYILKIAYMLTTGKTNLKVLPNFEHIENATLEFNMEKLIQALGKAIIENKKVKKLSPMFIAYLECNPEILSDFHNETDYDFYLRMGILALGYTAFVMDNDYIRKFIKKMIIKKGKL